MDAANSCWAWQPETPARLEQQVWLLRLEGPDARRFLHGQSSQAIELAAPGSALATCLISPTARMRALAWVLVDGAGAWLVIEAGGPEAVRTSLDRVLFPADQVQLGPLQPALLITPLGDTTLPQAGLGRWAPLPGVSQGDGPGPWLLEHRLLLTPPTTAHPLAGSRLLGPAEHERWRIQQGWPAAPGELNDNTNPFELGLAPRVSLSKGCYVGQETLAKLATYDGVKQQLRHWRAPRTGPAAADACAPGTPLRQTAGGRAGVITSVLATADGLEGLALVRRQALADPELLVDAPAPSGGGREDSTRGKSSEGAEGGDPGTIRLAISVPIGFTPPPVGAGGGGAAGA